MERERTESEKTLVYWLRNRDIWSESELRRRLALRAAAQGAGESALWSSTSTSVRVSWWRRVITVLTSVWRRSERVDTSLSTRYELMGGGALNRLYASENNLAEALGSAAHHSAEQQSAAALQQELSRSSSPSYRNAATMTAAEQQSGVGVPAAAVAAVGADGRLIYSTSQQSTSIGLVRIERRSRVRRAAAVCCCWPLWLLPLLALLCALFAGLLPVKNTEGTCPNSISFSHSFNSTY